MNNTRAYKKEQINLVTWRKDFVLRNTIASTSEEKEKEVKSKLLTILRKTKRTQRNKENSSLQDMEWA